MPLSSFAEAMCVTYLFVLQYEKRNGLQITVARHLNKDYLNNEQLRVNSIVFGICQRKKH